jgi:hypothetical protein
MGERFIIYRLPEVDPEQQALRAMAHEGKEAEMRAELSAAVRSLFAGLHLDPPAPLTDDERGRLAALAMLAVRCRSAVERDPYNREVQSIPQPEAPGRLALALAKLFRGLLAIGVDQKEAWRIVSKSALDCMPALRLAVLALLRGANGAMDTTEVATGVRHPTQTARRALEDLTAHGVVRRRSLGPGKADVWELTKWAELRINRAGVTFPVLSEEGQWTTEECPTI